ncbi:hypothetical protein SARC_13377, partial [Sphaeroforma arctica JP610]
VSLKPVSHYRLQWKSKGQNTRKKGSVWQPVFKEAWVKGKNKIAFSVGEYIGKELGEPIDGIAVELTDDTVSSLFKSQILTDGVLNWLVPHPVNFKLVWSQTEDDKADPSASPTGLYCWRAIPPTPHFIAVGMVTTTEANMPELDCIRCIPKAWAMPLRGSPVLLWDDSGTGGKRGSFWRVNRLGTLFVAEGHGAPEEGLYDLIDETFQADSGILMGNLNARLPNTPAQPTNE